MEKSRLNYMIDIGLLISFIITAISGLVLFFFMPSGVRQGGYQQFLGIAKGVWTDWHNIIGIAFIVLVVVHFALHWNWTLSMTRKLFARKTEEKSE